MKGRKATNLILILLGLSMVLSGCDIGKSGKINSKNAGKADDADIEALVPVIDEYDPGMNSAHFISEPAFDHDKYDSGITEYEVSYRMTVEDTDACFVLGNAEGEYGELILCELSDHGWINEETGDTEAYFTVKRFKDGCLDSGYEAKEIAINGSLDHTYEVKLKVSGKELDAKINGEKLESFNIPELNLGCVGTYKSRGVSYAYIDDISVSSGGTILLKDDFDGSFENNLFDYEYKSMATSAFSPYYIKTVDDGGNKKLRVSSGFVLSETAADTAPVFRREFLCEVKELKSAYLYMTALGSFEASINGTMVSEHFFDPGKMVYDKYLNYVAYDVTSLIEKENALDIALFHGFYDRGSGYPETAKRWKDGLAIKGELVLVYKDGSSEIIPTDDVFKVCTDTKYRFNDIYHGEIIDDRHDISADNSQLNWEDVLVDNVSEDYKSVGIQRKENESIKAVETRDYVSVTEPVEGHFVYDFGQNIAGTVTFNLKDFAEDELSEGQVVTFRYGELLNSENMVNSDDVPGTVWTQNLLTARATDYYVAGNNRDNEVTFAHTYHGFRYLEITGLNKALSADNLKAKVLSSGMKETGEFQCSSDIINAFYNNSRYSMRANLMDTPTDCAQRDERLGWAGDAQATSLYAMYQYDARSFYKNYLQEMASQQSEDGAYPDVAPFRNWFGGHSCWGDAPVVIAWNLYLQYGDIDVLEDNYNSMCSWVEYLVTSSEDYIRHSDGYGDHLSMQGTPEELSDTAWCAHSARLVGKMAEVLGRTTDAQKYGDYADSFTEAWQKSYIRDDWSVEAGILVAEAESETAYSLGIAFDLFPEEIRAAAIDRLKLLSEYGGYYFYPGYSGMPYYLPALAEGGYVDTAVAVLQNTAPRGLAHPLSMGLTTNPEELNTFRYTDEADNPYENGKYRVEGSLNHAAFSSVSAFFYTDILGIKPDEKAPGYEHFYIEPRIGTMLQSASGHYDCRYGTISVEWNLGDRSFKCDVPKGTTCTLVLPGIEAQELQAGHYEMNW